MPQLAQRFGFDLSNALARYREMLPNFLQRVLTSIGTEAEPHLDDLLLARCERLQDLFGNLPEISGDYCVGRIGYGSVFDEITEVRVFFLADGSFERDRLLRDLQNLSHLGHGDVHLAGDLFGAGFAAELLYQRARSSNQLIDRFDHVNWNSNR